MRVASEPGGACSGVRELKRALGSISGLSVVVLSLRLVPTPTAVCALLLESFDICLGFGLVGCVLAGLFWRIWGFGGDLGGVWWEFWRTLE